jgi:hypothetical protein
MKRLHVPVPVDNLNRSIGFCPALFASLVIDAFLARGETTVYGDGGLRAVEVFACCGEAPAE